MAEGAQGVGTQHLARRAWALLGLAALAFSGCLAQSTRVAPEASRASIVARTPTADSPLGERVAAARDAEPSANDIAAPLVAALRLAADGQADAAIAALSRLAGESEGDVRTVALEAQAELLATQQRWSDLVRLAAGPLWGRAHAPETAGFYEAARVWARGPRARMHFAEESSELPLLDRAPIVVLQVGGRPMRFLVDTGASFTTVVGLGVEEGVLRAGPRPVRLGTATETSIDAVPVTLAQLRIGGAEVFDWPALRIDRLSAATSVLFRLLDVQGVLGWDVLQRLDFEIDLRAQRLIVRRPHPEPSGARDLIVGLMPLVRVLHADGRAGLFILDTGAQHSFVMPLLLDRLPATTRSTLQAHAGAGGGEYGVVRLLPRLDMQIAGKILSFRDVRELRQLGSLGVMADGLLGDDLLAAARVRIDATNGRLWIEPY